jgi:hypothetical protein
MRLIVFVLSLMSATQIYAQQFELPITAISTDAALDNAIPGLAQQIMDVYVESDRDTYLNNLFRL